jgi:phosphoribosylformylglycinamidine synthase
MTEKNITPELIKEHGLTEEEYTRIVHGLGRDPNFTELGIYSVMWSEHCSYKSSKVHLKKLPTEAPWVICGPGENAGVIDIGDGQAAIFKMESHNHPSYIEPYQGAATGVGGILRDVFTMGARPVANLNALRFGSIHHEKTRHLVSGVVAGIGGYGNCVGVPTVGGETSFDASYNGNILVNAMTVGIAEQDKIFYSAAAGIGKPVVYVGSKTGRDGIHGATMASAEFSEDNEEKRPTVQVGDPFTEKLLIEACLELMSSDAIVAIQDMGAAGLTSSSVEMASKGGVGFSLNLDHVPQREENMLPYEMMLSESQERMLMILEPGKEEFAQKIFEKWGLDFAIIGEITDTANLTLSFKGEVVADIPINSLVDDAPEYERPWIKPLARKPIDLSELERRDDFNKVLLDLIGGPNLSSRAWVWEQYDHMVMADTLKQGRPGGDSALVRVHGTKKALAITTDCTPRYVEADPFEGGKQAVAETYRNISATGATPLAITDCLNFGNPEKPEIMGQFAKACEGIGEACRVLEYPVVSGNVSLYNETNGYAIKPTPSIGGVGLINDYEKAVSIDFKRAGHAIVIIGETMGHIGASIYLKEILGLEEGEPPFVSLGQEKKHGEFIRSMIDQGHIKSCHDISDGGIAITLAEMCIAGDIGANVADESEDIPFFAWAFGEDQSRYIVAAEEDCTSRIIRDAAVMGIPAYCVGTVGGDKLEIGSRICVPVAEIKAAHQNWMPNYMSQENKKT